MDKEIAGIYKFTFPNNKVYIGKSINIYKRFTIHKKDIYRKDFLLYRAFRKYGWNNVKKEIIVEIPVSSNLNLEKLNKKLSDLEIRYIAIYKSNDKNYGYNCTIGGEGTKGHHLSPESKNKIAQWHYGKKHSEETKKKMSTSRKGKHHTKETINKMKSIPRIPSAKSKELLREYNERRKIAIEVIKNGVVIETFDSISLAAKYIGSCKSHICKCLNGKAKTVKGYTFRKV